MDPPHIKVILRKRPKYRSSCFPHALSGWYIVPSIGHYCCHKIRILANNSVQIGQTVSWFHHKIIMPTATAIDIIIATAKYLTEALKQINKNPLLPPSDTITRKALCQIDFIFSYASSALKPQQSPHFKVSKVSTPKPVAAPPRLSPSTTQYFHNISPTTQKNHRNL